MMNKNKKKDMINKQPPIPVPPGVRYIGRDWPDFELPDNKPHILNKVMTGCGFTEWVLRNKHDVILCSPRKMLIENKWDQHKDDVFLVINELSYETTYDRGINNDDHQREKSFKQQMGKKRRKPTEEEKQAALEKLEESVNSYIDRRHSQFKPLKILVTYDSFYLIRDILKRRGNFDGVWIIVDEFQSLLVDSRFKSEVEMGFLSDLKNIEKVAYVSATPMLDEYIELIPELKDLPYYLLDWEVEDPTRLTRPNLITRSCKSVFEPAKEIIGTYLRGKFEHKYGVDDSGNIKKYESKEVVFFLNSVLNILDIISSKKLKPEQVNILCANTPENVEKIKIRLGKDWEIGKIPLEGEPHKMFTFCTRTVYLEADFNSECARTVVLSDANVENLAVDVVMDLPQILGRQRNNKNPWKNCAELYYILTKRRDENLTYKQVLDKKAQNTLNLLEAYRNSSESIQESLRGKFAQAFKNSYYSEDYVSFDKETGEPTFNTLVMLADKRAYEIEQTELSTRFSLFDELDRSLGLSEENKRVREFFRIYETKDTIGKLKMIVALSDRGELTEHIVDQLNERNFKEYVRILGIDRIKACGYNAAELRKELEEAYGVGTDEFQKLLKQEFPVGSVYTRTEAKQKLKNIYDQCDIKGVTPSAKDLEKWFRIKIYQKRNGKKRVWTVVILG